MKIRFGFGILILAITALSISAQEPGKNATANFVLDFQTTSDDSVTASTIETAPSFVQIDVEGETRTRFTCTVVLQGAVDLTGVNCDLTFDPAILNVVDIHEARGDMNFDGRGNIADVLALAQRFNVATNSGDGFSFFDIATDGASLNVIDDADLEALKSLINQTEIYWTSNQNEDLSVIRESFEVFQDPALSNASGRIDDIVTVLLRRPETPVEGFGFDGDARVAEITFEVVGIIPEEGTVIQFEDRLAIDEDSIITVEAIENASEPQGNAITILP